MNYYMLGLLYTYQCTSSCEMCGISCSPDRREKMDFITAKEVIRQAKENNFQIVGIAGGEPMIFQDEIFELLEYCKEINIASTISTNCFWGESKEQAYNIINRLAAAGVNHLKISTDDFHSKYVPYEYVSNVIQAAKSIRGFRIVLACTSLKNSGRLQGLLQHLQDETVEMNLMEQICYPIGRANQSFKEDDFIYGKSYGDFCEGQGVLTVTPNGDVYPCASMCAILPERMVGSIFENSLNELISIAIENKHNRFIEKNGIQPYYSYINEKKIPIDISKKIVDTCHGCYELFCNPSNKEHLNCIVEELLNET